MDNDDETRVPRMTEAGETQAAREERHTRAVETAERFLANVETVVHGKRREVELVLTALACHGHVLLEDVPGTAKTVLARAIAQTIDGARTRPDPVHARPAAERRDRPLRLQPARAGLRVPRGPDLRQRRPRRRDQPRDAEDAVGSARGDGRAAGDGRRRYARALRPVPPCSRPRTRSSTRARSPCRRRSSTASSCGPPSGTRRPRSRRDRPRAAARPSARQPRAGGLARRDARAAARGGAGLRRRAHRGWLIDLVRATRELDEVAIGASMRGSLALERAVRAWALLHGRDHVVPEDVEELFLSGPGSPRDLLARRSSSSSAASAAPPRSSASRPPA